ncbi:MAG: S26 family signal peptidase [Candidatus Methanoplasma sp.]|jgi:signal peptidase|nr:S26 family signal peptidase [Candidatus Methanoplasma sp.]
MERETKHIVLIIVTLVAVCALISGGVVYSSGVSPPFTTVNSWSMQHGDESQIGIIDTGDMVLVKDPGKVSIRSYVEGYNDGYSMFGDYGDVIIYKRGDNQNPVIHRAILYLEYNGDKTWSAPALADFPADRWSNGGNTDYNHLKGTLMINGLRYTHTLNASLDLDKLATPNVSSGYVPHSGYVTLGDNNSAFDQSSGITEGLIENERIKSVAWIEIPWTGTVKMAFSGDSDILDQHVPNSIPSLALWIISIVAILTAFSFIYDQRTYIKVRKELEIEKQTPSPSLPLEPDNDDNQFLD